MRSKSLREKRRKKNLIINIQHINIAMFMMILILFLGGSIVIPKKEVSDIEKRKLASFPIFSVENFISGNYFKEVEKYYNDAFPFRNKLIEIASNIDEVKGMRKGNEEVKIYMVENK